MDLLKSLIIVSEKSANIARLCRQNEHLFKLLIQKKSSSEANPRFVEDFKTLADVLIQEMVKYEIGNHFPELRDWIKGEENNSFSNKLGETIKVEIKENIEDTVALLQIVLNEDKQAAELLATEVHKKVFLDEVNLEKKPIGEFNINLSDLGIWIDPIDSTAEYINGIEESPKNGISISGLKCVTVLIGVYDKKTGLPLMGVINQPFVTNDGTRWSGSCFWGIPTQTGFTIPNFSNKIICVSSSENQNVVKKLQEKGFNVVEVSGAGYKILTVITGLADAYVLTKDTTFKWDTCGPQAILRSLSGDIVVYNEAIKNHVISVKYTNLNECESNCNFGGIIAYRNSNVLQEIIECLT